MFARSFCRAASSPLRQQARRTYASESTGSGSRFGPVTYTAAGAVGLLGAYFFYAGHTATPESLAKVLPPIGGKAEPAFKGGDQGFISLKVDDVTQLSPNTKLVKFALPDPNNVSGMPVASALLTKFQKEGDEKPTTRPYTPTSQEDAKGFIELIVKKYPDGPMSTHIHDLKKGDSLDFKGPVPKYPVDQNKHSHIGMIAGGTGITPMYQVLRKILQDPNDKTKVTLIFGNVGEDDILLRKELQEFENTYPRRLRVFYTLDNPPESWTQGKGFITKDLVKELLPEPKEENIKIFVCGPPGLYKAMSGPKKGPKDQGELQGVLKELGYSKDQVFKF